MTGVVISSSNSISNATETLSGGDESLLITSSGSIINTAGNDGIDELASNQSVVIDGLVYSADEGDGIGVSISYVDGAENLVINGQIQADTCILISAGSSSNSINVGTQGSIDSTSQVGINFDVGEANTITNAGTISADLYSGKAVEIQQSQNDSIVNSGDISGDQGVYYSANVGGETLENSGTITGGSTFSGAAIFSTSSSYGVNITNSDLLTDSSANPIGSGFAVLYFDDNSGTTSTIDNTGTISGSGYVIQSISDILDISNSGTIHGGLYSTAEVDVNNSGLWQVQAGTATAAFDLVASDNAITNSQAGVIDGAISFIGAGDTLDNAGKIEGTFGITAGGDTVTNSGDIDGSVTFYGTGATNTVTNTNASAIADGVTFSGSDSTLTNSGAITGDVRFAGADGALTNDGEIYGNLLLAGSGVLTNTGLIHGDVTLSDNDTFNYGSGKVTGVINASTIGGPGDLLEFAGNFGDATINDFVGGTGTSHDTIQFAANDFSTFAQVQAASTQQGADVVIKLDGTDSITLNNVTLSSLVAADFKFV